MSTNSILAAAINYFGENDVKFSTTVDGVATETLTVETNGSLTVLKFNNEERVLTHSSLVDELDYALAQS